MLHIRVTSPDDITDRVIGLAGESAAAINVTVARGAVISPEPADLVTFDLAREAADTVLVKLRELGLEERGTIAVHSIDLSVSHAAKAAEEAAPGYEEDAIIWDEISARTSAEARLSWSFLAFIALATQLAAIAVLLDQPVLIIGAMVLGPEFGPLAAICFGMIVREPWRVFDATRTLVVGFAAGIAITTGCAAVSRWLGWIDAGMLADRPATQFIFHPDKWSFIVAILAGIAGTLSITAGKSSPLVGVFISITTVPAAGNIAVGIALTKWDEVGGSSVQLGVNVIGLLIAGTITLVVQRFLWSRYGRHVVRGSASQRRDRQLDQLS